MSAHRVGGLTYRIMQWSTGKHLSVLAASKGGPRSRGHPAFDPPAGDVTERDYEAERIRVTKHFVEASAYCIDVGAYRESALRWRKVPGKGWVHGIYTNYVPSYEGRPGWYTTYQESGREVAEEKAHMETDEAVHANQSEYVADQVAKRLRASGMFGAPQETLSLQDAKDLGEQLTREGKAPVEAAPTTPPVIEAASAASPGSDPSPLAYLRRSFLPKAGKSQAKPKAKTKVIKSPNRQATNAAAKKLKRSGGGDSKTTPKQLELKIEAERRQSAHVDCR